ncbi:innexin shaking-B-like [Teleopsis dalmanni]|uniref:innexin shaking-B-like n=1 Tax=Teleopsis dalmanni TaxID=139649 RepID=UPI0018CEAE65|nr:innexin shaking-B-like [Teleopsis dalmanni]
MPEVSHVKIDSPVFRLHTNATVILLITFSIAVTTRQYVGNPIDCVHTRDIPEDVLNTYCWIHSTYTVVDAFMKKQGSEVPFPGVHNSQGRGPLTIKHTKYYQWVAFTLFFQQQQQQHRLPLQLQQEISHKCDVNISRAKIKQEGIGNFGFHYSRSNVPHHFTLQAQRGSSNFSSSVLARSYLFIGRYGKKW